MHYRNIMTGYDFYNDSTISAPNIEIVGAETPAEKPAEEEQVKKASPKKAVKRAKK